ncbi:MAG: hypothetical protein WAL56_12450 [Candidatus Sulfotelmatobacter sp.]
MDYFMAMNFEPKDVDAYIQGKRKHTLRRPVLWLVKRIDKHGPVVTTLATVAIAILTIFYVYYSNRQWREMQSAGEQTKKLLCLTQQQVAIAKAANDDTHNLLVATQAAILRLEVEYELNTAGPISGSTGVPSIGVRVTNSGKSAARMFSGEVKYIHRNAAGRIIQSKQQRFTDDTVEGGSSAFVEFVVVHTPASPLDFASDSLTVQVTVKYDDGFSNTRTQTFCSEMAVTPKRGAFWVGCGQASAWKQIVK